MFFFGGCFTSPNRSSITAPGPKGCCSGVRRDRARISSEIGREVFNAPEPCVQNSSTHKSFLEFTDPNDIISCLGSELWPGLRSPPSSLACCANCPPTLSSKRESLRRRRLQVGGAKTPRSKSPCFLARCYAQASCYARSTLVCIQKKKKKTTKRHYTAHRNSKNCSTLLNTAKHSLAPHSRTCSNPEAQ